MFTYKTSGVCSTEINLEIENDIIKHVDFVRGCQGNLKGLSALLIGINIDDAISKLSGIECGAKSTSCPDQLSKALLAYKSNN